MNTVQQRANARSPVEVWAPLFDLLNAHAQRADYAYTRTGGTDEGARMAWLCASKYRKEIAQRGL